MQMQRQDEKQTKCAIFIPCTFPSSRESYPQVVQRTLSTINICLCDGLFDHPVLSDDNTYCNGEIVNTLRHAQMLSYIQDLNFAHFKV